MKALTAQITYLGGLRTAATHLASQTQILTDAPLDNRGQGQAFSPTDLVAAALASCVLTIMGIKAEDKGWDISGAQAQASKQMASHPRRIARIELRILMPDRPFTDKQKSILEHAAHGCPVKRSLHPDMEEVLEFVWPQ